MKILQLTYSLSSGGAERFVVDLCNSLVDNPLNEIVVVSILSDKDNENTHYLQDLDNRVRYVNLDCKGGLRPHSFLRIHKAVQKEQPDVVHVHCNLMAIMPTAFLYRYPKYIHTLHNLAPVCLVSQKYKIIYKWFYRKRVQAVTISKVCQESYNILYDNDQSICITNGRSKIEVTDKFDEVKREIDALMPISIAPVFINIARCNPQKNHKLLFETFRQLPEAQLIVIGRGFDQSEFADYNKYSNIHILGEKKNVGDYLACSDFFILSSNYEGLPITLLEAMSMGVVPVSTPAGGVVDVIRDGYNGYMTKGFSQEDFMAKVRQAIFERGKISSDDIKKYYEENYSMKVCADKYSKIYES